MMKFFLTLLSISSIMAGATAQRTVGLLSHNQEKAYPGYNLIFPHNQPHVYLLNNCGEVVHSWTDAPSWRPGNAVYLLENGHLLKAKRPNVFQNDPIWAGGGGAIIEIRDWDNNLIWQFEQNDSLRRLHHDMKMLPNGNILMISWELKTEAEALQAGRNPALLPQKKLWPDYLLEVNPATNKVVWEWHAWDHLIQDFDPAKANYGNVGANPQRIDLNWDTSNGHPDWMHANAVDYNAELDQIILCVPTFHEVWVIDHSTTTEEARGSTGGRGGRGGDLLYRWGNPLAYRAGTKADQTLFYPHHLHWIGPFLDDKHPFYGKMAAFNNQVDPRYSTANVFDPGFDRETWSYPMKNGRWLPDTFNLTLTHPDTFQINSDGLSSVQFLPNGNVLICSGRWGYAFELTPQREIVWEYKTPLSGGNRARQGQVLPIGANVTFKMDRYPVDFPAFIGRDLSSKGFLELGSDSVLCQRVTSVKDLVLPDPLVYYPNPASQEVLLEWSGAQGVLLQVSDMLGRVRHTMHLEAGSNRLDIRGWARGMYLLRTPGAPARKLLIQP